MDDAQQPPHPRVALVVNVAVAVVPVLLAVGAAAVAPAAPLATALTALALAVLYVVAFRTEFASSRGSAVPTEPVLIAMLLALPVAWVPALVVAATVAGSASDIRRGAPRWQAVLMATASAWTMVGPVAALWSLQRWAPGTATATAVAIAVGVQLAAEAAHVLASAWTVDEVADVRRPLEWMLAVDSLLAVIGYCLVTVGGPTLPGVLLVGVPVLLLRLLAHDREVVFDQAESLRTAYTEVEEEARRDPMTGLLNRRGWEDALAQTAAALDGCDRGGAAAVLVADLDGLKATNDTYGHAAGDALICGFAELLLDTVPADAAVARLGGDEFAVLLSGDSLTAMPDLAAVVREAMTSTPRTAPRREAPLGLPRAARLPLSASLGVATYPPAASLAEAVDDADDAARVDKEMRRAGRAHLRTA